LVESGSVGLADAVRELRAELLAAMSEAEGQRLGFELDAVEMEFLVEVSREGSGDAGIKFWVVSVGAHGGVSSGATHRVTLTLSPKDHRTGRSPEISDVE
jgi:Trypsin-co-occurring domain 2